MNSTPLWVTFALAAMTLVGALGSQGIQAFFGSRNKRYELWFQRKSLAYENLSVVAGKYAIDPKADGAYVAFIGALDTALLYASEGTLPLLRGPASINVAAQNLRLAESEDELRVLQFTEWFDWMGKVSVAFRDEIRMPVKKLEK
jgi:hypothetical protein